MKINNNDKLLHDYFKYLSDYEGLTIEKDYATNEWKLSRVSIELARSIDILELFKYIHTRKVTNDGTVVRKAVDINRGDVQ